jgi:hypothetical protein
MRRVTMFLAGLVLIPMAVGCSTGSQVIRSQSPGDCDSGYCEGRPGQARRAMRRDARNSGSQEYVHGGQGHCPPGHGFGLGGHCWGGGAVAGVGTPDGDHFWGNVPPTYPAPGAMPGIVQYPYYTCKGPDCFFHQE